MCHRMACLVDLEALYLEKMIAYSVLPGLFLCPKISENTYVLALLPF